jgi:branched-subunit amino acid aminotransferase/4-amino-4-deoxychorismate lyase
MDKLVYQNNQIVTVSDAKVDARLAGLLYGWGVFTTLRIYDGQVFAFTDHYERLQRHAEKAHVDFEFRKKALHQAALELIRANNVTDGRMRITVLKNNAGSWRDGSKSGSELLIFTATEGARKPRELNLTSSPYRLLSSGPLVNVKRTSMLEHFLALEEARSRDFDDAVLLNERGEMVSTTTANIFWVQDTELFTPFLATGCIAGITRALVLNIARRINILVNEGSYPITRLLEASEIFLTSTTRGIVNIRSYDYKTFDNRFTFVAKNIRHQFLKLTHDAKMKI